MLQREQGSVLREKIYIQKFRIFSKHVRERTGQKPILNTLTIAGECSAKKENLKSGLKLSYF